MSSRWSDDLRERMAEYEAPAPEALFEQIVEAMPASQPAQVVPLHGWRRWVGVAATVAVMAGGYLLVDNTLNVDDSLMAEAEDIVLSEQREAVVEQIISEQIPSNAVAVELPKKSIVQTLLLAEPQVEESIEKTVEVVESVVEVSSTEELPQTTADKQPTAKKRSSAKSGTQSSYYAVSQPQKKRAGDAGRLSANVFASGAAAGHSLHGTQQVFQINSSLFGDMPSKGPSADNSTGDMLLYSGSELLHTDIHHYQPVRFGFTLRYHISDRWAVESGLTYSMLYSRSESGHTSNYSTDKQSLHYLGLPVSGVYNLWSNKRFVIYLSAGAMVEKCVSGSVKTTYTINGKNERTYSKSLMVDELQFSAMASAGAQVNLSPLVGLYVEPGVGYWFNNGSDVATIYGEQPLNFNLNLGLRFTLR